MKCEHRLTDRDFCNCNRQLNMHVNYFGETLAKPRTYWGFRYKCGCGVLLSKLRSTEHRSSIHSLFIQSTPRNASSNGSNKSNRRKRFLGTNVQQKYGLLKRGLVRMMTLKCIRQTLNNQCRYEPGWRIFSTSHELLCRDFYLIPAIAHNLRNFLFLAHPVLLRLRLVFFLFPVPNRVLDYKKLISPTDRFPKKY